MSQLPFSSDNGFSTAGNVTGDFIIGDGSQLTNLPSVTPTAIANGTSNVTIATANGSITFGLGGSSAGAIGDTSVSLGVGAGAIDQGTSAVAIGFGAGGNTQARRSVAIGTNAGASGQGTNSVAIGWQSATTTQGTSAVAIGVTSGQTNQGAQAVAVGTGSGITSQGQFATAIGPGAAQTNQGTSAVALGRGAGGSGQGAQAIAIGWGAATLNQGANAIAIGYNAVTGSNAQAAGSIVFNATGVSYDAVNAGLYIAPVRNDVGNTTNAVYYNSSTNEVTYGPVSGPSVDTIISDATITPSATNTQFNVIALSEPATVATPVGAAVDGAKLTIRIRDSGLAQPLSWSSVYQVIGTTLPTTTVGSKTLYVGCIYNDSELTWDVVSVAQQA